MALKDWAFDLARGSAGLAKLELDWQVLCDSLPQLNFMQCPQWIGAYQRCFAARDEDLCLITARRGGELRAVWPLTLGRVGIGPFSVRELRGIVHEHMILLDVAADPYEADLWPALLKWLQRQALQPWDRIVLPLLAQDAVLMQWLGRADAKPVRSWQVEINGSSWLDCDRPFDALLKSASSKHRGNYSRALRRAQELGALRYEVHVQPDGVAAALEQFKKLEASGWKGVQKTAISCDPVLVQFYGELTAQLAERGQFEIDLLWLGDRVIASGLWFRTGNTMHFQKIAYDESLSAASPGVLLMGEALQRMCSDPAMQRLSLISRASWADGWRTSVTPVWRYTLYRDHWRGRLCAWGTQRLLALKAVLKPWVKRLRERRNPPPKTAKTEQATPA